MVKKSNWELSYGEKSSQKGLHWKARIKIASILKSSVQLTVLANAQSFKRIWPI